MGSGYRVVYKSVGSAGRESDEGIFRSGLTAKLQDHTLNLPSPKALHQTGAALPSVIVADEAFPLTVNIMRPYPGRTETRLRAPTNNFQLPSVARQRGGGECVRNALPNVAYLPAAAERHPRARLHHDQYGVHPAQLRARPRTAGQPRYIEN